VANRLQAEGQENSRVIRVFEDLHTWFEQLQDYETIAADRTLVGYLAAFPKPPAIEATENLGSEEGVQLLTVHAAKGLEFDTVFVVNCTAKSWSERTASGLQVPKELQLERKLAPEHEQRRLMYVAITRAKQRLQLSAGVETAGGQRQAVTPMMAELLGEEPNLELVSLETGQIQKVLQDIQRLYPLQSQMPTGRLPFESAEGWIDVGVGALGAYNYCPHEFYLQYVLGVTQPFGPQLSFGTSLHAVVQAYYEGQIRGEKLGAADLLAQLDSLWSDRGYESRQLADRAKSLARTAVERFVAREEGVVAGDRKVLGSELKITLEIPEIKLRMRGRIDAYFETPEGIEIRDFKTGSKRDPEKLKVEAKDSFQLRTYALAYELMTGQAPAKVTLDYLVTGAEGSAVLTPRILANHRAKLAQLAEGIRRRDFAPAPQSEFHHCAAFTYYGEEDQEAERVA